MTERTSRAMTKTITVAGLAAGVATWSVAAQTPPDILPIPELPKITFPVLFAQTPHFAIVPPILQPEALPKPAELAKPSIPVFNLQPAPVSNTLTFEGLPHEPLDEPTLTFPAVPPIFTTTSLREDSNMRIDKALLTAAMGAALANSPVFSQGEIVKPIPPATESGQKAVLEKVQESEKPVDLKKELESVKALLEGMNAKQKQLGDAVLGKGEGKDLDAGVVKKLDDLATSIKTLDETVKKLEEKVTKLGDNLEKVRLANSSPLTNKDASKELLKPTAIVKLINGYGDRVTMIVNGTPHRLEIGETKDVNVPSGKFEYALPLAGGEIKSSTVKDSEIVTLKIK